MKTFTTASKKALFICFVLGTTFLFAQTTHIVNNNAGTSADFTNLQAAIDAAANGDIIHAQQSSTSYGNITLDKELTIIGRSHSDASYVSEIGTLDLVVGSSNSTIKGLKISNIADPFLSGSTLPLVENIVLQDNNISSISFGTYRTYNNILIQGNVIVSGISLSTNTSNILITNNVIAASSISFSMVDTLLFSNNILSYYNGVSISNNTFDLLNISNCIFVIDRTSDREVAFFGSSGAFQINNCLTYNYNSGTNYNFNTGTNITISNSQENIDPLFTFRDGSSGSIGTSGTFNPTLDNLTLQASSPVVDDGLYEGYNYKTLGTPTGLPSLKIDSYDPTVPKNSDLTVTITAKTN